jgi:parallel beta-helix repeat protein
MKAGRSTLFLAIALTVGAVHQGNVQSNAFFVAPSGSDGNAGTISAPWRTLRSAVSRLSPGDTLYVRGGLYTGPENVFDSQTSFVPSGTPSNRITIEGYQSEAVTIRPPNIEAIHLTSGSPSYLTFRNLTIDLVNHSMCQTSPSGIYLSTGAHHNQFDRIALLNGQGNAVFFSASGGSADFNEFTNGTVRDVGIGCGVNQAYGFYIATADNVFANNEVFNINGFGFNLYDAQGANVNRNVVRNNKIYNTGLGGGTNYAIVHARGSGTMIYNNIIYSNRGGILIYSGSDRTEVYNNTIYNNRPGEGIALQYYASAPVVKNNIIYQNGSVIADYGGGGAPVQSHNVASDPSFRNSSAGDFTLQSNSIARDTGTVVPGLTSDFLGVARPQGDSYDVGALEYSTDAAAVASLTPPQPPQNVRILIDR